MAFQRGKLSILRTINQIVATKNNPEGAKELASNVWDFLGLNKEELKKKMKLSPAEEKEKIINQYKPKFSEIIQEGQTILHKDPEFGKLFQDEFVREQTEVFGRAIV